MSDERREGKRRQSRDITRGELLYMIATLRGDMYGLLNDPFDDDQRADARERLSETSFDLTEDDRSRVHEAKLATDGIEAARAESAELREALRRVVGEAPRCRADGCDRLATHNLNGDQENAATNCAEHSDENPGDGWAPDLLVPLFEAIRHAQAVLARYDATEPDP